MIVFSFTFQPVLDLSSSAMIGSSPDISARVDRQLIVVIDLN